MSSSNGNDPSPLNVTGDLSNGARLLKDMASMLSVAAEALDTIQPDLGQGVDFYDQVKRFETALIERALRQCGGNQSRAARLLKLKQTTLHGKIRQYNIRLAAQVYSHDGCGPPAVGSMAEVKGPSPM